MTLRVVLQGAGTCQRVSKSLTIIAHSAYRLRAVAVITSAKHASHAQTHYFPRGLTARIPGFHPGTIFVFDLIVNQLLTGDTLEDRPRRTPWRTSLRRTKTPENTSRGHPEGHLEAGLAKTRFFFKKPSPVGFFGFYWVFGVFFVFLFKFSSIYRHIFAYIWSLLVLY
jgi:hypothetical protein